VDEPDEAERERDDTASSDEPRWRARARGAAIAFLGLGLLIDLERETTRPTEMLGAIAIVIAIWLRTSFGVAALAIDVVLQLLDAVGAHGRGRPLLAVAHAASAIGLATLALVLYRRSHDEAFERRATLGALAAMAIALIALLCSP
jgi:hypothetical protein